MSLISEAVRFSLDEDDRFLTSLKAVRREGIPRNFLAGKSGACFGTASDARDRASGQLGRSI